MSIRLIAANKEGANDMLPDIFLLRGFNARAVVDWVVLNQVDVQ